jgi:cytosine/adenosine deaminase-related metal-dependent hydrolase
VPNPPPLAAYRARWVIPIDRPPLENGLITVAAGRIVAIGKNVSGKSPQDLGDVALLPGLVNAHTHLEFSLLDRPLEAPGTSLPAWIRQVIDFRRQLGRWSQDEARLAGLAESRQCGVAAVGEIATAAWPDASPREVSTVEVVVFRELLGLSAERVAELSQRAREHVADRAGVEERRFHVGLSPHAPYTVHPDLLQTACSISREGKIPVAMHLAESREELQLLQSHSGDLVDLLRSLGAWHPGALPRGLRPLDYLQTLAKAHRALVIHGNYLAPDEIEFMAARRERMSAVYCPRTHAFFGHDPYPLAEMLAAGIRVAVGTDSRASNPDLNLFAELQHIARHHPSVAPEDILRMGTLAGAEALGLAAEFGSLTPGKRAKLAVVALPSDCRQSLEWMLHAPDVAARPLMEGSSGG